MGGLQQAGRLLAQSPGQGGLVQLGVGGPILGVGQLASQVALTIGRPPQLVGHAAQVGADLGGVEAPERQREGTARDLVRAERCRRHIDAAVLAHRHGAYGASAGRRVIRPPSPPASG